MQDSMTTSKPYSPSCDRNKDPILAVLREHFADRRRVLEIGSGTGQHAVHFAAAMPWLTWQCTDAEESLDGIRMWLEDARLPNMPEPFALQARTQPTPGFTPPLAQRHDAMHYDLMRYDAVFSANTLHIMGWPEVQALFASLPAVLADDAVVAIYGPFNRDGNFSSDSNRDFDGWLKARDARSGIRDFEAVNALAEAIGLLLIADIAMPANNRMLLWRIGQA
jgi:SAM-dependent methyltransferase